MVPQARIRALNDHPIRAGRYVLYWMTAFRRTTDNFALDRAIEHARTLGKPLLILEALRVGYRWASDRHHRFVLDGMEANQRACEKAGVRYCAYVEREPGQGKGLLQRLAQDATVVVADDYPCFFLPRMVGAAARKVPCLMEAVDSNGLLPMRERKVFSRAVDFRRHLQKTLPDHLGEIPKSAPLSRLALPKASLPAGVAKRWPMGVPGSLSALPIDHRVQATLRGGQDQARKIWRSFLSGGLATYDEGRNHPDQDASSGLSPWLHFGHLSTHRMFTELAKQEKWTPQKLALKATGSREGWWDMSSAAQAYLDQFVTWRELGFNMSHQVDNYTAYESLPAWALKTLGAHEKDDRPYIYSVEEFEAADTHDPIWNAAQRQLAREGRMHNYLRMLWGKKILEWTKRPQDALKVLIELNNKYAIDGRDPNSYSGIFWVLGRYDRAWGPERPIFGKIRFMSSESTRRKLRLKSYLQRYGSL